ncbi:MAG: ATP-binding protein [Verrucomicrobia bacterium]|nr:ATP-binding protein [Verrucomicrobiota bacterium]
MPRLHNDASISVCQDDAGTLWAVTKSGLLARGEGERWKILVSYACNFAEGYLRLARIRFRLDIPGKLPDYPLTAQVRHHLFLIFKEAVHNIIKHATASEVWIRIAVSEAGFRSQIEDNGQGFEVAAPAAGGGTGPVPDTGHGPPGHGLSNMRERAGEIGARVEWQSQPGHSTTVRLEMDFERP